MTYSFWTRPLLLIAGLTSAGVGFAVLFLPVGFHASSGIILGDNHSLMSEVRAPGAALLTAGMFILASLFVRRWQKAAMWLSAALFTSYALARLFSIAVDGIPHGALLGAAGIELAIGALCALMIYRAPRIA